MTVKEMAEACGWKLLAGSPNIHWMMGLRN